MVFLLVFVAGQAGDAETMRKMTFLWLQLMAWEGWKYFLWEWGGYLKAIYKYGPQYSWNIEQTLEIIEEKRNIWQEILVAQF